MSYITKCPKCKAEGELQVVGGTFTTYGMWLTEDGFSFMDCKQCDTADELVECRECRATFSLGDLTL